MDTKELIRPNDDVSGTFARDTTNKRQPRAIEMECRDSTAHSPNVMASVSVVARRNLVKNCSSVGPHDVASLPSPPPLTPEQHQRRPVTWPLNSSAGANPCPGKLPPTENSSSAITGPESGHAQQCGLVRADGHRTAQSRPVGGRGSDAASSNFSTDCDQTGDAAETSSASTISASGASVCRGAASSDNRAEYVGSAVAPWPPVPMLPFPTTSNPSREVNWIEHQTSQRSPPPLPAWSSMFWAGMPGVPPSAVPKRGLPAAPLFSPVTSLPILQQWQQLERLSASGQPPQPFAVAQSTSQWTTQTGAGVRPAPSHMSAPVQPPYWSVPSPTASALLPSSYTDPAPPCMWHYDPRTASALTGAIAPHANENSIISDDTAINELVDETVGQRYGPALGVYDQQQHDNELHPLRPVRSSPWCIGSSISDTRSNSNHHHRAGGSIPGSPSKVFVGMDEDGMSSRASVTSQSGSEVPSAHDRALGGTTRNSRNRRDRRWSRNNGGRQSHRRQQQPSRAPNAGKRAKPRRWTQVRNSQCAS